MKTKIIFFTILLGWIASCAPNSEFLAEDPKGKQFPDNFCNNKTELELMNNSMYYYADRAYNRLYESVYPAAAGADDIIGTYDPEYVEFDRFQPSGIAYEDVRMGWQRMFELINIANGIINNYTNAAKEVPEAELHAMGAQAYYLRAMSYFYLVRFFNNMPLITTAVTPDRTLQNSPSSAVYELIISDLEFAETWLPIRWTGYKENGAATKGAAKALLAEVYLHRAGFPVNGGAADYAKAAAKAKELIDNAGSYGYGLRAHFSDVWDPYWTPYAQTPDEVIFWISHSASDYSVHSPLPTRPREKLGQTEAGWELFEAEHRFFREFPEGERKDATFVTTLLYQDGSSKNYTELAGGHPLYAKYWADNYTENWSWERMWETKDWRNSRPDIFTRYSEILLIYAEAQARATGSIDPLARECLNAVRNRAFKGVGSSEANFESSNVQAFIDAVVWERAWEFAGWEWASRWFDLVRLELVETAATQWRDEPDAPITTSVSKKNYFLHIPEIDVLKNPNLANNNPEFN